ncbi:MAG: 2-C-methyl-D-erythritol 4-phosphate cytidylyltransferase [Gammaproteobacteria bacterium]
MPRLWAVIPAAGCGSRFGGGSPKQYAPLLDRTVIEWSLSPFLSRPDLSGIVVALAKQDRDWARCRPEDPRLIEAPGGEHRAQSVANALALISTRGDASDWVLVHDAARPCLHPEDLEKLINGVKMSDAGGLLAAPVEDTLKRAEDDRAVETVSRENLWRALTPQMFRLGDLNAALTAAIAGGLPVTDEASAIEIRGGRPILIEGRADNLKLTRAADLPLAAAILKSREQAECV